MRALTLTLALVCTGCGSDSTEPPPDSDSDTTPTGDTAPDTGGDTGTTGHASVVSASCALQVDNALRVDCTVELDQAAQVEIAYFPSADSSKERVRASSEAATTHTLTLWGMRAQTEHSWELRVGGAASGTTGTYTTGTPPAALAIQQLQPTGTSSFEYLTFNRGCQNQRYVLVVDSEFKVVWYQATGYGGATERFYNSMITDAETAIIVLQTDRVLEFGLDGRKLLDVSTEDGHFPKGVHHDIVRRDDRIYVLNRHGVSYPEGDFVVDGVYVLDPQGTILADWDVTGMLYPGDFPDAIEARMLPGYLDLSHINGIWLEDNGDWLLSFKHLDNVVRVVGDIDAPDFGDTVWVLGPASAELPSDFAVSSSIGAPTTFTDVHNPVRTPSGSITMIDNGPPPPDHRRSRGIELELDEGAGTADITAQFDLGGSCPTQSSLYPLPNGNFIGSCTSSAEVFEYDSDGQVLWSLDLSCPSGVLLEANLVRVVPVDF